MISFRLKGKKKESWMRGQQSYPLIIIIYEHVNSKLGRPYTKAPCTDSQSQSIYFRGFKPN